MNETEAVAAFVRETTYSDIPEPVIDGAKRAIMDVVGVSIYGSHHAVGERIAGYVEQTFGDGDASLIARGTTSTAGAALANGTFAHAIDYDDTFESIVIHPSAPVFSAALAATDSAGSDTHPTAGGGERAGRDLLTAYVLGVETAFRIGHSTYPAHYDNGWHATGTVGTFGSVAAAASVYGLTTDEIRHALAIAASGSSALKKNFGSMTKPLHAGHAAQIGVRATLLASEGFTGDDAILEGGMGYGAVMTPGGSYDPDVIVEDLGDTWAVEDIGFKPYPSGVISHAAMEVLRRLVSENDLTPDEVERVTVTLDEAANEMLIHAQPSNALQAKFSIEFCLAAVLREGDPGVQAFTDEYVTDPETRTQLRKVERAFEPDLFGDEFAGYGARVVVETSDGDVITGEQRRAPGSPSAPITEERLAGKFHDCAGAVFPEEEVTRIHDAIRELESDGAYDQFVATLRG